MQTQIIPAKKLVFFFLLLICNPLIYAQTQKGVAEAYSLLQQNETLTGIAAPALAETRVSDTYFDALTGTTLVYLQQTCKGIDVYNAICVLAFKDGKLVSKTGANIRVTDPSLKTEASPALSASDAVRFTAIHLKLSLPLFSNTTLQKPGASKETEFGGLGIARNNIKAILKWVQPENSKKLVLCWFVDIQPMVSADYWNTKVNAQTGVVIGKDNYTVYDQWHLPVASSKTTGVLNPYPASSKQNQIAPVSATEVTSATYKIIPYPAESPNHPGGAPAFHLDPWTLAPAGSAATTLKWNYDGISYFENTRGNNVLAQEDNDGNNGFGKTAKTSAPSPSLKFDYQPNFTKDPKDSLNQGFAITNLFYWNNIMHDLTYLYGFDEVSGNFQKNNLGRGGLGNDYVIADAQDGAGFNNANFSTGSDGGSPRMQMFLFSGSPYIDGDLDNSIVCHEYTHGISTRLTGGPSNAGCLFNYEQGGEGWSDYFALMATTNWATAQVTDGAKAHPMGTYAMHQPINGSGIRSHPYSTNTFINPLTYANVQTSGGEEHNIGEVWCAVLWDLTWALIQTDGINKNIFDPAAAGGNSVAMKLVMAGLKLQKCGPGFLDARDAILKADTILYSAKYSCLIWNTFARRGMGFYAKQGSSNSFADQTVDYTPAAIDFVKRTDKKVASQGELVTYTLFIRSSNCGTVADYKITDTLPPNVTYISSDGVYDAAKRLVTISNINLAPGESRDYKVVVKTNTDSYFPAAEYLNEPFAANTFPAAWKNTTTTNTFWKVTAKKKFSSPYAMYIPDSVAKTSQAFETIQAYPVQGVLTTLSFWHSFDTEPGYDGGVVEYSINNGLSWADAGAYMIMNGYTNTIDPTSPDTQLKGRKAFIGNSNGFINTVINLTPFAGKNVRIRFLFATDIENGGLIYDGWYIDDIVLKSEARVYNIAQLRGADNRIKATSDTLTSINSTVLPAVWGTFTVTQKANASLLQWKTQQELNTEKFVVERSSNGQLFTELGSLPAAGFSNGERSYEFTDVIPLSGKNYYRIRQADKEGRFTYSPVKELDFAGLAGLITVTPNPATDKINITVTGNEKTLHVRLINAAGQLVKTYTMKGQYLQAKLPETAAGVYYVWISGEGINTKQKLIIQ